jgi:hypothetical protein
MKILTEEGVAEVRNLISAPGAIEALSKGQVIDCSSCATENSTTLPANPATLVVPGPSRDERPAGDADNAILLYKHLAGLSPRAACNPRLWVSLGFLHHQEYMLRRWPLEADGEPDKAVNKINDRYFLKRVGHMGYFRNSMARLWWTAHMTVRDDETEHVKKFELTRLAFSKQDYQFAFLLRKYGASKEIATNIFDHFRQAEAIYINRANSTGKGYVDFIRHVGKRLNYYSSVYILDLLPSKNLIALIKREADDFFRS